MLLDGSALGKGMIFIKFLHSSQAKKNRIVTVQCEQKVVKQLEFIQIPGIHPKQIGLNVIGNLAQLTDLVLMAILNQQSLSEQVQMVESFRPRSLIQQMAFIADVPDLLEFVTVPRFN
ncbi:hypothetical protein D3C74_345000 [compost metagenome]